MQQEAFRPLRAFGERSSRAMVGLLPLPFHFLGNLGGQQL